VAQFDVSAKEEYHSGEGCCALIVLLVARKCLPEMGNFMTRIEIAGSNLTIEILGWDKLWSFKNRLEFPLEHVVSAHRWQAERDRWYHGLRAPGTNLPGVIVAGSYHRREQGSWRH
jgi:hypothetical protein